MRHRATAIAVVGCVIAAAAVLVPARPAAAWTGCGAQIAAASWVRLPEGARLIVTPSRCGRRTGTSASHAAFSEALVRGRRVVRGAVRRSLYSQFVCHAEFATQKPTWDLEAWRPDVGYLSTVFAGCNPT